MKKFRISNRSLFSFSFLLLFTLSNFVVVESSFARRHKKSFRQPVVANVETSQNEFSCSNHKSKISLIGNFFNKKFLQPLNYNRNRYCVLYDNEKKIPLVTIHRLNLKNNNGEERRFSRKKSKWKSDERARNSSYDFDYRNNEQMMTRGHMVGSGDFLRPEDSSETFYLTNVAPQTESLNNRILEYYEGLLRKVAKSKPIEVITGVGFYQNQEIKKLSSNDHISDVVIPHFFYKIAIDYQTYPPKVFAFLMDNKDFSPVEVLNNNIDRYVVPIAKIENLTGFKFFPHLEKSEKEKLATKKHFYGEIAARKKEAVAVH